MNYELKKQQQADVRSSRQRVTPARNQLLVDWGASCQPTVSHRRIIMIIHMMLMIIIIHMIMIIIQMIIIII